MDNLIDKFYRFDSPENFNSLLNTLLSAGYSAEKSFIKKPTCDYFEPGEINISELVKICQTNNSDFRLIKSRIESNHIKTDLYNKLVETSDNPTCNVLKNTATVHPFEESVFSESQVNTSRQHIKQKREAPVYEAGLKLEKISYPQRKAESMYYQDLAKKYRSISKIEKQNSIKKALSTASKDLEKFISDNERLIVHYQGNIEYYMGKEEIDQSNIAYYQKKILELQDSIITAKNALRFPNNEKHILSCVDQHLAFYTDRANKIKNEKNLGSIVVEDPNFESFYTQVEGQTLKISYQTNHCGTEEKNRIEENIGPIYKKILSDSNYFDSKPMRLHTGASSWQLCKRGEQTSTEIKIYEVQEPGNDTIYTVRKIKAKQ
ncbi:MAG: hypothetical protein AB8E15_01315 [Bdellovibrionales bacterium]